MVTSHAEISPAAFDPAYSVLSLAALLVRYDTVEDKSRLDMIHQLCALVPRPQVPHYSQPYSSRLLPSIKCMPTNVYRFIG